MIRTAVLLVSGNAFTSVVLLVRNLVVARLISIEDYGIASTFAISMAIVEMASNLGLQQLMVQDRGGNDPHLQAGLHGFNALRGLMAGVILFALAGPLAAFLGVPDIAWAYQLMALVPVLRGLSHFDTERFKRHMRFGPGIVAGIVPAVLSVAMVWPLDRMFGDWRVMLWSIVAQTVLGLLASHLLAERRFSMSFDRAVMAKGLRFGWPLMLNGVLLFFVMYGEKLIVGRELGMAPLGIFAMGFTLTLTPTLVLARSAQAFFLPQLAAVQGDDGRFQPMAAATMQAAVANGLVVAVAIVVIGPPFVIFVLGEKFAALTPLLPWLAILQAVRVFKAGPCRGGAGARAHRQRHDRQPAARGRHRRGVGGARGGRGPPVGGDHRHHRRGGGVRGLVGAAARPRPGRAEAHDLDQPRRHGGARPIAAEAAWLDGARPAAQALGGCGLRGPARRRGGGDARASRLRPRARRHAVRGRGRRSGPSVMVLGVSGPGRWGGAHEGGACTAWRRSPRRGGAFASAAAEQRGEPALLRRARASRRPARAGRPARFAAPRSRSRSARSPSGRAPR